MGTFVTANPHVPLPADRTNNPKTPPAGLSYEVDASHINDTQNAVNDLLTHTAAWVNVKDYGAKGDGVTNDTTAVQAAITALFAWSGGGFLGRALYFPAGKYMITASLQVPGGQGLHLYGEGRYATQIQWFGPANTGAGTQPMLRINSSQHVCIEHLTFWGNALARPSECIFFDYSPVVFAGTAFSLNDIHMGGSAADSCFDYGIRWSGDYGNNSEAEYWAVTIEKFAQAGVSFEGSQQKSHSFYGCQINGAWDGTVGHPGGQVGIDCTRGAGGQGGSFQFYGGGVGACSIAAFRPGPPNDPLVISGVQSERCYRFYDGGGSPSSGAMAVTIQGCRIDNNADHAADLMRIPGVGPVVIEGNQLSCASVAPLPYIQLLPQGGNPKARIRNNYFLSQNSVSQLGVVVNTGGQVVAGLDIGNNQFLDSGFQLAEQIEFLNTNNEAPYSFPAGVNLVRSDFPGHQGRPMISVAKEAFTAATTSQVLHVLDLPRGTKIKSVYLYQYDGVVGPSISAALWRLGVSSGGQELILDADATATQVLRGADTSELGTALTGTTFSQGGYVKDFYGTTSLYLKLTATGANVGTGSATRLTAGLLFIILDLEVVQRYVYGA